jgi:DNA-binding CsgD family transcriptional regulator
MENRREIVISDFVRAIRDGMDCSQLMEEYQLSLLGLVQALGRLMEVKAMEPHELYGLMPVEKQEIVLYEQRRTPRHFIHDRVLACDIRDPAVEGTIQNITEQGFQVKGIRANVEETRRFLILSEDLLAVRSFAVEAECRWTESGPDLAEPISGYRINAVSEQARTELHKLVVAVALSGNATYSPRMITEVNATKIDSDERLALAERTDPGIALSADVTKSGSFDVRMEIESFSAVTNGFAMPCFLIDEGYNIVFANEFSKTLGLRGYQFAGSSFLAFFPYVADSVGSFVDEVLSKKTLLTFAAWMQVDENKYFVKSCLRAVRSGDQRLALATLQDLTSAIQKLKSTESRVEELLDAYKEVLTNLANTEAIMHQRDEAVRVVIDSVGDRLKEERQHLAGDLTLHLKPIINRLKDERLSDRGVALLNALENLVDSVFSVSDYRMPGIYAVLTPRETEVCDLILAGYGSKAIAGTLGLSLETVTTHRSKIRKKLGLGPGQSIYSELRGRLGRLVG